MPTSRKKLSQEDELRQAFAKAIVQLRTEQGMSQEKLAEEAELSLSYISLLERGQRNLTVLAAAKIAQEKNLKVGVAKFPWAASGRAIGLGRTEGFTKLIFDEASHRVIGGGIVGARAGDLIAEVALAIEMGCEAGDIGHTIHPHPTLSESVGMSAEVFEGSITDLDIPRKK